MFTWEEEYLFALDLVKEAAALFLPAYHVPKNVVTKASSSDLVTETDKAIEGLIFGKIRAKYPTHCFIGEETVSATSDEKTNFCDKPTWIVDPIDGTMNFVHRYPHTCIVIGFAVAKIVHFGVIYNPVLNQLYTGRRGFGAQLNGFPLAVTGETKLNRALLVCEMGSRRDAVSMEIKAKNMKAVCSEPDACHGLRMAGSAALNMCAVACGGADAYWECGMHIWDMAAASIIVEEAGGVILSPIAGEQFDFLKRRVIAASSVELATVLQSKIQHIDYPTD